MNNTYMIAILRIMLVAGLLPIGVQAFAAPTITSVSATPVQGSTVTINGAGFGAKSPAAPIYWANFESSINPTGLGQKTSWDWINGGMALSKAVLAPNSTQSLRWNAGSDYVGGGDNYGSVGGAGGVALIGNYSTVYMFCKRYYAYDVPAYRMNHKTWRAWTSNYSNDIYTGSQGGLDGRTHAEQTGTFTDWTDRYGDLTGAIIWPNRWSTEEWIYRTGSVDRDDGTMKAYINGVTVTDRSDHRMKSTAMPNSYSLFYLQDDMSNETQFRPDLWIYYDDIYVDNTWARVMVGNAPTYSASTQREIQIPVSWSDTAITVTVNQGALTNIRAGYLYVFDANGNVNTNGYPLCTSCPSPPTRMR